MSTSLLDRAALGAALGALLVIGLRPATTRAVDPGVAVVRTPGATMGEARAVAESIGGARVVDLEAGERPDHEGRLHLVGWGLDGSELRRWQDRELLFHARPLPPGIRSASWPGSVALGATVAVAVEAAAPRGGWLVLEGEDGVADSVVIPAGGTLAATLRHTPRAAGTALYRLRLEGSVDSFTVLVAPPALPPALILASAPSREWSDLRDWLGAQGGMVTLRIAVARDRTRLERVNAGTVSAAPLTPRSLAGTGVVITDARTLAALPRAERDLLRTAVIEGLGMIVVQDGGDRRPADPLDPWRLNPVADLIERQVRPRVEGRAISPTPVAAGGKVMSGGPFGTWTLMDDGQGGTLAMAATLGRGRIAGTVVLGAGRWRRGGEDEAFARYWHTLVDAAAREDEVQERWELPTHPVLIDQEELLSRGGRGPARWVVAEDTLDAAVDPLAPSWRRAKWWPRGAGWTELDGTRLYVGGPTSWATWRAAERARQTQRAIARRRGEAVPGESVPVRVPWPLLPFYILFVGAAAVLWRRNTG